MKDEIIYLGAEKKRIAILNTPEKNRPYDQVVVFLNAGLIHRVGPQRLYVNIAQKLSEKGVASLRFDFSGIGDSEKSEDNELNYYKKLLNEVDDAINHLQKLGFKSFVLFGICSGGEIAHLYCLTRNRINKVCLVNGFYFSGIPNDKVRQILRNTKVRYYKKSMFKLSSWIRIFTGQSFISKKIIEVIKSFFSFKTKPQRDNSINTLKNNNQNVLVYKYPDIDNENNWLNLVSNKIKILLILSEGSNWTDIYNFTQKSKISNLHSSLINIRLVNDVDHTFTPIWSQQYLEETFIDWLL